MSDETFNQMLTGGHPNSLGRTVEVVDIVLANPERLEDLYQCYFDADEIVRLRTSNALKRVCKEHPDWLLEYVDRLLAEITQLDQASAQWTLADLFGMLAQDMTQSQVKQATAHLQHNLATHNDWIVLNRTMNTLTDWAKTNPALREWMMPHLRRIEGDSRKSVARTAQKSLKALGM